MFQSLKSEDKLSHGENKSIELTNQMLMMPELEVKHEICAEELLDDGFNDMLFDINKDINLEINSIKGLLHSYIIAICQFIVCVYKLFGILYTIFYNHLSFNSQKKWQIINYVFSTNKRCILLCHVKVLTSKPFVCQAYFKTTYDRLNHDYLTGFSEWLY